MTLVTTPSPSSLSTMNSTTSMTFWYSTYWTTSPPTMFAISSEPMQCWGRGVHSKDWNPKVLQTNEPTNQLKDSLFDKVSTYPLHILSKRRLRTFNKVRQKKLLKMSKIKGGGSTCFWTVSKKLQKKNQPTTAFHARIMYHAMRFLGYTFLQKGFCMKRWQSIETESLEGCVNVW